MTTRRHPGDVVRVGLGALGVIATGIAARRKGLSRIEADAFRLVNDLPAGLEKPLVIVMQAGSLAAVPAAGAVALVARRPRMARDLVVAGVSAYALAKVAKAVVGRGRPGSLLGHVVFRGATETGLGFPSGHVAVAAALATAAGPHLGRTARRATWLAVGAVAIARMFVGAHLPVDVVGGAALGWLVGGATHLLLGAPTREPGASEVQSALQAVGLRPFDVVPAAVDARGSTPFFATLDDGRLLFVKAVGREQRDADFLFKAWRFLSYRHVEDEAPFTTPKQQVEHEAFVSLFAERAGARTPRVITTAQTDDGSALLVMDRVTGCSLDEASELADATLADMWRLVRALRAARVAHRDLRLANVVADGDGRAWLIDFGFAEASASNRALAGDVAGLLAASSMLVGAERAVASAVEALGVQPVREALPLLQPLALPAATRGALRRHRGLLDELRAQAAAAVGSEPPSPEPLARVRPRTLLFVAGGGFAVHLLLPRVGEVSRTIDAARNASWGWLVVGLLGSSASYLAAAIAQLGAVTQPLALGRTAAVQVASSFTNRLTPGSLGGLGVNLRYLERSGLQAPEAVAAVGLNSAAGLVVHVVALAIVLPLVGTTGIGEVNTPDGWEILVGLVAASVVAGLVLWSPLGRRRLIAPAKAAAGSLVATLRIPSKALQVFGGSVGVTAAYLVAFAASLQAFGVDASVTKVTAVFLGGSAVGAVAPTPGGLGAVEAALVAGLTAVGVAPAPAVSGVLAYRLLTYWLPIIPGWLTFRALQHRAII